MIAGNLASIDAAGFSLSAGNTMIAGTRSDAAGSRSSHAVNQAASVAVRADRISLNRSDSAEHRNSLTGIVHAIEYHGASVRLALKSELADEFNVTVEETVFFDQPFEVGDRVTANWHSKDNHLLDS